ncbi:PHP domain-containing protein [Salinibacter grassmerensis]|uniref:PHP domain-containing protein n=1 Tax=Salinibacter grassmerensis TaxID=3040353 RepID=UPI0021E88BA3|nr:PHP domain-containing protein [Salinibacter grassmerensis]
MTSDAPVHADLHAHTQCSDGYLSPEALVARAAEQGLQAFAVTDHDTVEGLPAARDAAAAHGLRFVSGVELSVEVDDRAVHLLGYGFDPEHPALTDYLSDFTARRRERLQQMVRRLADQGVDVSADTIEQHVGASAAPGRPHLARALAAEGHVDDYRDAFEQYLGMDQPVYVPAPTRSAGAAIDTLHAAGGAAVLAHPGQWMPSPVLRALREQGLDGIECYASSHPDYLVDYYRKICRAHDLLMTGGSDYHGGPEAEDDGPGSVGLVRGRWERFRDAAL